MRFGFGILALLVITACGGAGYSGGGTTTAPDVTPVVTTSVEMRGTAFNPALIQVSPGATVTFTNNDGINHNVTFSSTGITSIGDFSSGARTAVMPAAAGTYGYHCTLHPGMTGSVKVQ